MASLVAELQAQALNPDAHITDLLRKVKVVAAKLGLSDVTQWVEWETNGYPTDERVIPVYREIHGLIEGFNPYRGWLRVQFGEGGAALEERLSKNKTTQPISEIEAAVNKKGGTLMMRLPNALMHGLEGATDVRLTISNIQLVRVLEGVRNSVLIGRWL
jgi:hypothetical protein